MIAIHNGRSSAVLLHGDCLELFDSIAPNSIDLIMTDLPYGTTGHRWDTAIPFEAMWQGVKKVLRPHGAAIFTGSNPFTANLICSNLAWYRTEWIWDKLVGANFFNLKTQPWKRHENVIVFCESGKFTYNPIRIPRTESSYKIWPIANGEEIKVQGRLGASHYGMSTKRTSSTLAADGLKNPESIISIKKPGLGKGRYDGKKHPTQKPVALMEYFIKTYSNEGDTVLDFTMGSGSTGVACMNTGRNFVGIEMDASYFKIAEERITKAAAQKPATHPDHSQQPQPREAL